MTIPLCKHDLTNAQYVLSKTEDLAGAADRRADKHLRLAEEALSEAVELRASLPYQRERVKKLLDMFGESE